MSAPFDYSGLRVLGIPADFTACGHYRMITPFTYLSNAGAYVHLSRMSGADAEIADHDVIVVQRQYSEAMYKKLDRAVSAGKQVYYEIDDDLHSVIPSSPVYSVYHEGTSACRGVERIMRLATGMTVSTPDLAEVYSRFCPNIRVVPNAIDFGFRDWEYNPPDKDPEALMIGWSGGSTHQEDLDIVGMAIPRILKKHPHVKLALNCSGIFADYILDKWDILPNRVHFLKPVDIMRHPEGLGYFDIAIAPLKVNAFNTSKSNLKVIEYGAKHLPVVASVCAPYARTISHGIDGLLAATEDGWFDCLDYLIQSENARVQMGDNLYQKIIREHNLGANCHQWAAAWTELTRGNLTGNIPAARKVSFNTVGRNDPCPCGSGFKYKKCVCFGSYK